METHELIGTAIAAAGGSAVVIGGMAAWAGRVIAKRMADYRNLVFELDLDLRKRRIPLYQELWAKTEVLPQWPRPAEPVTYGQLYSLSEELRDWYFQQGGHLLSGETHRAAYSPLQTALSEVARKDDPVAIGDDEYERIRKACSTLRTHLADDVQTRRKSAI